MAEFALRLIVNLLTDEPVIVGTATVLSRKLLVTAKHTLMDIPELSEIMRQPRKKSPLFKLPQTLDVVQIFPNQEETWWIIWSVTFVTIDNVADLALLVLDNPRSSHPKRPFTWKAPIVAPFPPRVGHTVSALGHRLGRITLSMNTDGNRNYSLNSELITSIGVVRDVHQFKRDNYLMPFPCYRVAARFDGGMSGGPVFDETGKLCGIVCANLHDGLNSNEEPVSYVSSLWPLFRLELSADRGPQYPRGTQYQAIEIARGGLIKVVDFAKLERYVTHFNGVANFSVD